LLDGLLAFFDSAWTSLFLGAFVIWVGWVRARRRPPTSITAGGGRIVFAIVGVLLLIHGFYQLLTQP
jgi:hypothetical protein